jgi:uncharacterized protein YdcH (DUF465 family)
MSISLAEIRVQSRQRADMESSQFVSDSELNTYINSSIAELHDVMSDAYGSEYFVTSTADLPIVSGTDSYTLPTNFYELRGIDVRVGNEPYISITRFNFRDRNKFTNFTAWTLDNLVHIQYHIVGGNLLFRPAPTIAATYKLWYTPLPTRLVNDGDQLNDYNSYAEYVIVDAAIKMLQKEESDVTVLFAQKQALEKRIRDKVQNRDANSNESITDIYSENEEHNYRRGI